MRPIMRVGVLLSLIACQPPSDTTADLASGVSGDRRIYLQMELAGAKVMQDVPRWRDEAMPALIYALEYEGHEVQNLQLQGRSVQLNPSLSFEHIVLAWKKASDSSNLIFTCHLYDVHLGAQHTISALTKDNPDCFVEEGTNDYVRQLAKHCVTATGDGESRFIFLEGKDFACDLSETNDSNDSKVELRASCLVEGADNNNEKCLDGKVRECVQQASEFADFITVFKERMTANGDGDSGPRIDEASEVLALQTTDPGGIRACLEK